MESFKGKFYFGTNKPNELVVLGRSVFFYAKSLPDQNDLMSLKFIVFHNGKVIYNRTIETYKTSTGTDMLGDAISFRDVGSYTVVLEATDREEKVYKMSFLIKVNESKKFSDDEMQLAIAYDNTKLRKD